MAGVLLEDLDEHAHALRRRNLDADADVTRLDFAGIALE